MLYTTGTTGVRPSLKTAYPCLIAGQLLSSHGGPHIGFARLTGGVHTRGATHRAARIRLSQAVRCSGAQIGAVGREIDVCAERACAESRGALSTEGGLDV